MSSTSASCCSRASRAASKACRKPNLIFWNNTRWLDPLFFGRYPEDGLRVFGNAVPTIRDGDMATIQQPLDFFGANIYNGQTVRAGADGKPEDEPHPHIERTMYHQLVTPPALYWGPKFYYERSGRLQAALWASVCRLRHQQRIRKDSAAWYCEVIASNSAALDD